MTSRVRLDHKAVWLLTATALVIGVIAATGATTTAQIASYEIGAQGVLTISVFDEPSLSGKYAVELDGSLSFPLVGRIKAAGLSLRDFESDLRKRLPAGHLPHPHGSGALAH